MTRDERQDLGVRKWISARCRATLMYATGVGKTRTALKAIKAFMTKNQNKKITVIVPTDYLKLQWLDELSKNGLFNDVSVEVINSAIKYDSKIDLVILDECHRYASDTFYKIFEQRSPKLVLGLSATFNRLDGRHELLNKFCPVCDYIGIKEAINNKWLSPYKEYKVLIDVPDISEYLELNRQFIESFSMFQFDFNLAMKCLTNVIYRRAYAKKIGLSAKEIDAITFTWNRALKGRKSFVMNHPLKLEITRKILDARPNSKAITFSATIKQAEQIKRGFVVHSGKTKKKNRVTIEEFSNLTIGVINTAKSLDEGADIKGLNLAIILSNTSSQTQKTQRIGRVIRYQEGKEAEIFTLVIRGTNEESWYNTSTAGKNYIEIDVQELDEILYGERVDKFIEKEAKESDLIFRL